MNVDTDTGLSITDAVDKGNALVRGIVRGLDTPLTHYAHLAEYGWVQDVVDRCTGAPSYRDKSFQKMHAANKLSPRTEDNLRITWKHREDVRPRGYNQRFLKTGGYYTCVYNHQAIVAQDSVSPRHEGAKQNIRGSYVIPLQRWSDVVFLQWQQYCLDNHRPTHSTRYIIRSQITNKTTIRIANQVLSNSPPHERELKAWPDPGSREPAQMPTTFPVNDWRLSAILATPNGVGPAHLLADHPHEMGGLMIGSVTLFYRPTHSARPAPLNLLFRVVPKGRK